MRLTSLVLHSSDTSEDVEFALPRERFTRYVVRSILGIDAEQLIPKFYSRGAQSGDRFYEYTMKPREIVVRVVLNPDYRINEDVAELRDELYRLISNRRSGLVQLQFRSGGTTVCVIDGMITKFEVLHFTQVPELQITFDCPDPIFRAMNPVKILPGDLPTGSPIIIPDDKSTAPHGFSFKVEYTGLASTMTIQDHATTPEWQFSIAPTGGFAAGDILSVSSEYRNKSVYHDKTPGGGPIMDKVVSGSVWPQIWPGGSIFYFNNSANWHWLELEYYPAFWGL